MANTREISFAIDYMPARLLGMAFVLERRFDDIVATCPQGEDGMYCILEEEILGRLLDCRLSSVIISQSALSAYMSYYGYDYSEKIEGTEIGNKRLRERLDFPLMVGELEHASRRFLLNHEKLLARYGDETIARFLRLPHDELDKLFYYPLIKTSYLPNSSDPTVATLLQMYTLKNEILNPDYLIDPAEDDRGAEVNLKFDVPAEMQSECTFDKRFVRELYGQHNLLWELLHCAPPQTVQDFIRYVHKLDESTVHFTAFINVRRERDGEGKAVLENRPKYVVKIG